MDEKNKQALELAQGALIAAQPRDITPEGWQRHEQAISAVAAALNTPASSATTGEAVAGDPYAYVIEDEGQNIMFCTKHRHEAQEHINDAISERDIEGAGKWRAVPVHLVAKASDATLGGVDWLGLALDLEQQAKRVDSQTVERSMTAAARVLRLIGAAAPDSAQQGEDEPPLPKPDELWGRGYNSASVRQYARTYHAHMMRKLGDGVSIDTEEFQVLLGTYARSWPDFHAVLEKRKPLVAHIDAKLAQARAEGFEEGKRLAHEQACRVTHALMAERDQWKARAAGAELAVVAPSQYVTSFSIEDGRYTAHGTDLGDLRDGTYQIVTAPVLAAAPSPAAAKEHHLPGWERGIATVTMTGHQLRAALKTINPDGVDDLDQLDDDLTFGIVQHKDDDGKVSTGLCCWNDDTDGVIPLDAHPTQQDSAQVAGKDGEA